MIHSSLTATTTVFLLLLAGCWHCSAAFVVKHQHVAVGSTALAATLESQPQQRASQQARPIRPVFVVGEVPAAMGAALALNCLEVLTGRTTIPPEKRGAPPQQPVSLFTANNLDQLSHRIAQSSSEPILHLPIDVSGAAAGILTPHVRNGISFLGIQPSPYDTQGPLVSAETARKYGILLQSLLNSFPSPDPTKPSTYVTLDLSLHLALLQANCLPQSKSSHQDSFHVLTPEGGSILAQYFYDTNSFGGGTDPLACPTKETVLSTPPTFATAKRSITSAAAYTALRGNGMDPISSAAIAGAVATILGDAGGNNGISWTSLEQTVQLSRHIRQFGAVETPGALRRQYTDYGYK